jgi:hypothetical protein
MEDTRKEELPPQHYSGKYPKRFNEKYKELKQINIRTR